MKLSRYLRKPYVLGLSLFLIVAAIGAVTIPLFFFVFYEKWGSQDSFLEAKFIGYYITAIALPYLFIKGVRYTKKRALFTAGFLTIPLIFVLSGFLWFRFMYTPYDDSGFHSTSFMPQSCSFTRETVCMDNSLRDILPNNPITSGDIPDIVNRIRSYKEAKDTTGCDLLITIEPLQGTQFDDIALYSPNGKNWSNYCEAIVIYDGSIAVNDNSPCGLVSGINVFDSGYRTGETLPNIYEECLAYFQQGT